MNMKHNSFKDYYNSQRMSDEAVQRVVLECKQSVRNWRLRWATIASGIMGLALLAYVLWFPGSSKSDLPSGDINQTVLLAIKAHGNRCPDCNKLPALVSELHQKHQNDNVLILMHDMKNTSEQNQSKEMLNALDINDILKESRRHRILLLKGNQIEQEFPANMDANKLSQSLSVNLENQREPEH